MAENKKVIIDTRLGAQEVEVDKVISFPKGLIGLPGTYEFTLLQIREGSPFLLLQSMQDPGLGLLVADPFSFIDNYTIHISDAEQKLLKAESASDLAVLVTASIPPGKPEEASLSLSGPILINYKDKKGLQIAQADESLPDKFFLHQSSAERD